MVRPDSYKTSILFMFRFIICSWFPDDELHNAPAVYFLESPKLECLWEDDHECSISTKNFIIFLFTLFTNFRKTRRCLKPIASSLFGSLNKTENILVSQNLCSVHIISERRDFLKYFLFSQKSLFRHAGNILSANIFCCDSPARSRAKGAVHKIILISVLMKLKLKNIWCFNSDENCLSSRWERKNLNESPKNHISAIKVRGILKVVIKRTMQSYGRSFLFTFVIRRERMTDNVANPLKS